MESSVKPNTTPLLTIFDSFVRPFAAESHLRVNHDNHVDQAITDSDNGDDSDDDPSAGVQDKSSATAGHRRTKTRKAYVREFLPMVYDSDPSKSMIKLSTYLTKRRKWPYRGWHKRFFILENGYMTYGKSEQEIKRGRFNAICDIGLCFVTFIRESQRINIDETNHVYHLKIKEKKVFEQWLEQIALHQHHRRTLLGQLRQSGTDDQMQQMPYSNPSLPLSTSGSSSIDRLHTKDFAAIQEQLSNLSDILEHIKQNASSASSTPNLSLKFPDAAKMTGGLTPSPSIGSASSSVVVDFRRQDYFDEAKKVFDNLNNLCKSLSSIATEQEQQRQLLTNTLSRESDITYQSISSADTLSRQGSIFYDASESAGGLPLNEDTGKLSDSEGSSCGEDDVARQLSVVPQLKPPRIKWRRVSLPSSAPDTSNVGLWNIMRKAIGKDLSRIALPVILNEPLGLLQKLCEEIEYSDLLDRAAQTDDQHLRLVYVGAFIISTYSSNYYRTGRKNFNPLLGETYECIREDKGWKFIAEQVSHHPPISVCTCDSPNFNLSQKLQAKIKFWGKSMEVFPDSENVLVLPKYNETITWNKCKMCIHNVLSPDRWIDHYGDVLVESSLGNKARISFIQSDARTRLNNVAGDIEDATGRVVHKIFGHWHENVFFGNDQTAKCIWRQSAVPENSKQYYGFTRFAIELNELDDDLRQQLPPTDTRFRPDQRLLEAGQADEAETEKARIEQAQRSRTSAAPSWFKQDGDAFTLIRDEDPAHSYWKKRDEHWQGIQFVDLW